MCALGDKTCGGLHVLQTDVRAGSDVDDNAVCTGNAGLQQRAGDSSLGGVLGLACTLGAAHAHVGIAGILHDGAHIGEVQVDEGGHVDQGRDGLNALTQHVVGSLKGIHQGDFFLTDHLQALVGDDDQAVNVHQQIGNALLGQTHLALALKGERLGNDANGQNAQIMCHLGHNGCCTGAGAAAHTGGDKDHLGALEGIGDLVLAFLSGALADLRVCTRTATLGQLGTQLHLDRGMVLGQCLLVGIHGDELHALQAVAHHAVHGVAAAAAYTDHFDRRNVFVQFFVEHQCHNFVLHRIFMWNCAKAAQKLSYDTYITVSYHFFAPIARQNCFFMGVFFASPLRAGISCQICAPSPAKSRSSSA